MRRRRYRGRHRRRSFRAVVTVGLLLLGAAGLVPGAYGGYLAKITNNGNSAATNPYFTCTAAQGGTTPQAYFTYPFGEAAGVVATDASGNNRLGTYTAAGVTLGVANSSVCPRDKRTVISLNGSSGFVSGPVTPIAGPNVFTLEIWFKTGTAQGKLIGFGDQRTTTSGNYDRHLYIDSTGRLVFGVYPNAVKIVTSTATVTDNAWHHAVGTLSAVGMVLYLDGQQVAADSTVTTAQTFTGFWRIGFDNLNGWTSQPGNFYFNGSLAFASVYTTALTATQVAQHYRAGT